MPGPNEDSKASALAILLDNDGKRSFLERATEALAVGLGVRWAGVAGNLGDGRAEVVAMWDTGKPGETSIYNLRGTPCGEAAKGRGYCVFPERVTELFPEDELLIEMGAVSFHGQVFRNGAGQNLGHVFALDDMATTPQPWQEELVGLIAAWVGTEIEKHRAEEALRESRRLLRAVIDASPAVINAKDLDSRYVLMNRYQAELYGVDPIEAVGKTAAELMGTAYGSYTRDLDRKIIESGEELVNFEEELIDRTGAWRNWLTTKVPLKDKAGRVHNVVTVALDITERKRAEESLRVSEAQLNSILDNMPYAAVLVDQDLRVRLFNQSAEATFGYVADEVLGRPFDMFIPEHLRDLHCRHVEGFVRSSENVVRIGEQREIIGLGKDGSEFPIEASVFKLQQGGETLFTVMLCDVSERKRMVETLLASEHALRMRIAEHEEAHERLEIQSESLTRLADDLLLARNEARAADRAKSEFLAAMSHELRTPLNAIIGFSEVMKNQTFGPIDNVKYREYSNDIHESGQHLLNLINDILDLSKVDSGLDELYEDNIEVPAVIRTALKLMGNRVEDGGIKLELELADQLPALRADERKLKQILVNLISNAVKFTDAGGEVTLKTWCRMDSGYVIQIVDTGIGIAPEDIPKALSRFGQVDGDLNRQYEGTGLGLPLTKALVELHGGTLDLQSEVGVGTTVTVRFPAARIVAALDNSDSQSVEGRVAS